MAKTKLYSLQMKNRDSDPEGKLPWYCPIEAQFVSRTYLRGYVACSQGYYPSPDIRIVDAFTGEVVEEIKGNGKGPCAYKKIERNKKDGKTNKL